MLKVRQLRDDRSGAIVMIVGLIILGLVMIWLIGSIAGAIVPLAIFLVLAIVLIVLVKRVLLGGESLGLVKGLTGAGREVGKESVGLMKGASREYKHFKGKEGGW